MRTAIIIAISVLIAGIIFLLVAGGLSQSGGKEDLYAARHITYSSRDKNPYGSYVPFKLLEHYFDGTKPKVITKPFAKTYVKNGGFMEGSTHYFLITKNLFVTQDDVNAMYNFVRFGNQLFLVLEKTDSLLESSFNFKTKISHFHPNLLLRTEPAEIGTAWQSFSNAHFAPDTLFTSRGPVNQYSLDYADTAVTTILGTNEKHEPNFFRVNVGNGQLFVLLNPAVWTNTFLLEKNNIKALEHQMAYMQQFPSQIYWDEYYKYQTSPQQGDFSSWQVLLRHPPLRWALWLAVLLLLLYVLFEGKRRQRLIPPKPALANTSLDFAETLGRLYYLHHHNGNLAQKMIQHLLEYIRNNYFLNTSRLDQQFVTMLARKSGHPQEAVAEMIAQVHTLRLSDNVSDEELQHFYNSIYQFYLKAN